MTSNREYVFRMYYVCIADVSMLYYMNVCHMRHNTCRKLAGYVCNTYSTSVVRRNTSRIRVFTICLIYLPQVCLSCRRYSGR